jgi:hypothetical protein
MKHRASPISSLLRLILALAVMGQVFYVPAYGGVRVSAHVGPVSVDPNSPSLIPFDAPPGSLTGITAVPDYSIPRDKGKIKLQWISPSAGERNDGIFSYLVKYATFSVTDTGGSITAWWNHPNCLTALDPALPSSWGIAAHATKNSLETVNLTGLANASNYYFGVKAVSRYMETSDYDDPLKGIATQAQSHSTPPPWTPNFITDLSAKALTDYGKAQLQWTEPMFIDTSGYLVSGRMYYQGEYCIQYSTVNALTTGETITNSNLSLLNNPDSDNNWAASTRILITTGNVSSGDYQQHILTGLTQNTTYYVHVFSRSDWPYLWSYASYGSTVTPRVTLGTVVNLTAIASGSSSTAIGSYINLSWTNPSNEPTLLGVRIAYSTTTYPSSSSWPDKIDRETQLTAQSTSYQHIQLLPRTTYFYTLFAYDNNGFYSNGVSTFTFTGVDLIAPAAVGNLTGLISAISGDTTDEYLITLNWTTPPATPAYLNSDYQGVRIYYSTYTANQAQQSLLADIPGTNGTSQQYAHHNLSMLTSYYYTLDTYDAGGNTTTVATNLYISEQYISPSKPVLVSALAGATADADIGCTVSLKWTSPPDTQTSGVTSVMRTDRYANTIGDVQDSSLVYSVACASNTPGAYTYKQLTSNTSYYISLFASSKYGLVSRPETAEVFTQVPWIDTVSPSMPLGVKISANTGNTMTLQWHAVNYNADYSKFSNSAAPRINELSDYRILRSSFIASSYWNTAGIVKSTVTWFVDTIPDSRVYFYKVRAYDASGNFNDSHIFSSQGDIIVYNPDGSYMWFEPGTSGVLAKETNTLKSDLTIKFTENTADEIGSVLKSMEWQAYKIVESTASMSLVKLDNFSVPGAVGDTSAYGDFALAYQAKSSNSTAAARAQQFMSPQEAAAKVSMYYFNGVEWLKIGSTINAEYQTVSTKSKFAGRYQLRMTSPATEFTFYGIIPKIITPNKDGRNDRALFRYANPKASPITIKIFDVSGRLARQLHDSNQASDTQGDYIFWDGTDNDGMNVNPGVYIYQLTGEGKTVNGTVVVAR